ncbi:MULTISPECIES: glycosyltransferase family 2 protein [Pseudonocardia]|uniref:Glycosyltransferase, GT2 family n=1 Tax=Pseudonocardia oroxyli TaxID=366584 RepID=A0A1G7LJQ1_PSEOR|nr:MULTISPECIES: glycosyltransferase [Pseudonocardia]MCF7551991.1 glycosyltransferase [Pseudonocardia sp. WMMC193]SDF49633.1 Glycosyltransferase, GT2 family [Pseudonocardia oroxyli]
MNLFEPAGQPPVTATVVVCVYTDKRWADIVAAVNSVAAQDVRPVETIVVVDHNPALLERCRAELTGVTVLPNAHKQGLSGARNTAIEAATGEVVVFLDDDASAREGWLRALLAPYADKDVIGVGGIAHPRWPVSRTAVHDSGRPSTLPGGTNRDATGELDWIVGCTYTGQPTEQAEIRNLMGCNMSLRAEVFERVGGFAEDIGRIGKNPLGCEETELCIRARQAYTADGRDVKILFEPAAAVDHRVSDDRVDWSYLRRRSWAEGLSKAAVSKLVGQGDALSTESKYVATVLPKALFREVRHKRPASAAAIVTTLGFTAAGYLRGKLPGATAHVQLPASDSVAAPQAPKVDSLSADGA